MRVGWSLGLVRPLDCARGHDLRLIRFSCQSGSAVDRLDLAAATSSLTLVRPGAAARGSRLLRGAGTRESQSGPATHGAGADQQARRRAGVPAPRRAASEDQPAIVISRHTRSRRTCNVGDAHAHRRHPHEDVHDRFVRGQPSYAAPVRHNRAQRMDAVTRQHDHTLSAFAKRFLLRVLMDRNGPTVRKMRGIGRATPLQALNPKQIAERVTGIEPALSAWETLHDSRNLPVYGDSSGQEWPDATWRRLG